jgi:hypothetical protein
VKRPIQTVAFAILALTVFFIATAVAARLSATMLP